MKNNEQAIVVLSAGSHPYAKEYAKAIDGIATLQRNHYAAFLHKQTGLPVLVTGGTIELVYTSEAAVMADTLKESFNVNVSWQENKSVNTAENAIYSAVILKENGIDTIYLVTHAWHMPRSVMMFKQQGIKVNPGRRHYLPAKYAIQTGLIIFRLLLHCLGHALPCMNI